MIAKLKHKQITPLTGECSVTQLKPVYRRIPAENNLINIFYFGFVVS